MAEKVRNYKRSKTEKVKGKKISGLPELNYLLIYKTMYKLYHHNYIDLKNLSNLYINKRNLVINLIKNFMKRYQLSEYSLLTAINYVDRIYVTIDQQKEKKFYENNYIELISLCCALMASKFVENDAIDIGLGDLSKEYNKFSLDDIHICEKVCIEKLKFYLHYPTVFDFVKILTINGILFKNEVSNNIKSFSAFILNITKQIICSDICLKYDFDIIAFNIIKLARKNFNLNKKKFDDILKRFNFEIVNKKIFNDCYISMKDLIYTKDNSKYSSSSDSEQDSSFSSDFSLSDSSSVSSIEENDDKPKVHRSNTPSKSGSVIKFKDMNMHLHEVNKIAHKRQSIVLRENFIKKVTPTKNNTKKFSNLRKINKVKNESDDESEDKISKTNSLKKKGVSFTSKSNVNIKKK
jgi:hypothetical protein